MKIAIPYSRIALALTLVLCAPHVFAQESIDKVNGSITAQAGETYGDLETVNGSIQIESGARARGAETVNGSIRVGDNAAVGTLGTVNGSIRIGKQLRASGDIETVNGSVFVDDGGSLRSVATVNGSIGLVDSDLSGGIETVNGDITVGAGSHVKGGIKVEKPTSNWMPISIGKRKPPRIVIGPNAVVEGPLVFEREVKLYVHDSARIGSVSGATAVRYSGSRAPAD
ncbi:hypothetical protein [Lysobacter sp. M2-1]|uniref:hypothetical protein n=1 Tax=Lysobacter sp. M2-1 TaxID=2916839 RepID=UPI001F581911|nr:hypothetical protein [Lysobacter sp. M2-1]